MRVCSTPVVALPARNASSLQNWPQGERGLVHRYGSGDRGGGDQRAGAQRLTLVFCAIVSLFHQPTTRGSQRVSLIPGTSHWESERTGTLLHTSGHRRAVAGTTDAR